MLRELKQGNLSLREYVDEARRLRKFPCAQDQHSSLLGNAFFPCWPQQGKKTRFCLVQDQRYSLSRTQSVHLKILDNGNDEENATNARLAESPPPSELAHRCDLKFSTISVEEE